MIETAIAVVPAFLNNAGVPELLLILVIILVLFGSTKIPALMRGVGQGVVEFKKGMSEAKQIDQNQKMQQQQQSQAAQPPAQPGAPATPPPQQETNPQQK